MSLNVPGVVMMALFYVLVVGTGVWASFKAKRVQWRSSAGQTEMILLGNRGINMMVGVFTMTATVVGGAFIVGLAETVYNPTQGLVWGVVPVTTFVALSCGGLFFAKTMRDNSYITLMDPFQIKYGKVVCGLLSVAPIMTDIIWVTTTLIGLGSTMNVILDFPYAVCIWLSTTVAIIYTLLGGLYSVAYTDIVQLILIFASLWLSVPFILLHPSSADITETAFNFTFQSPWVGKIETEKVGVWIDDFLVLSLGTTACQDFHQRILSASSSATVRYICFIAAGLSLVFGIPSLLIGAVGASTDWNKTSYGLPTPYERGEASHVLPIVMQHLTPNYISAFAIAAVAAAVMSTVDSSLLSAAAVFSENIYKSILRTKASDREMQWVIRLTVVLGGVAAAALTPLNNSIMAFWMFGSELLFVIMFPQLVCVLFSNTSNGYGSLAGFISAVLLRVLCGEPSLGLPVVVQFPGCSFEDGVYVQRAPIRTICMFVCMIGTWLFSNLASFLFSRELIPQRWDVLKNKSIIHTTKPPVEHEDSEVQTEADVMLQTG